MHLRAMRSMSAQKSYKDNRTDRRDDESRDDEKNARERIVREHAKEHEKRNQESIENPAVCFMMICERPEDKWYVNHGC